MGSEAPNPRAAAPAPGPIRHPVLFVLVDCLRHDRVAGEAGGAAIPRISGLRDAGTWFTQAVSSASLTTPAVASLFTGLFPLRHGVRRLRGHRLPGEIPTLAGELAEAGYSTRAEVSGPLLAGTGLARGFARYRCREEGWNVYSPFGRRLLDSIRRPARAPWFLFLHVWVLHRPRKVGRRYDRPGFGAGPYDRALSTLDAWLGELLDAAPPDTLVVLTGDHGEAVRPTDSLPRYWRRVARFPRLEPLLDRRFRRRRDRRRLPPVPGEGPCHGFDVTEELVRVPLVFAGGPFPAGLRISAPVRHVDVMPTLLEAAGLPLPPDRDGRSLLPLLRGETLPPAPAWMEATGRALAEREDWIAGVRTARWKYARRLYGDPPEERLFDLDVDPREEHNRIAESPPALAELRAEFARIAARERPAADLSDLESRRLDERLRRLGYLEGET